MNELFFMLILGIVIGLLCGYAIWACDCHAEEKPDEL